MKEKDPFTHKKALDDIKTTITLSMGSKNRLRKLKGTMSYEQYINHLIRKYKPEPRMITNPDY